MKSSLSILYLTPYLICHMNFRIFFVVVLICVLNNFCKFNLQTEQVHDCINTFTESFKMVISIINLTF